MYNPDNFIYTVPIERRFMSSLDHVFEINENKVLIDDLIKLLEENREKCFWEYNTTMEIMSSRKYTISELWKEYLYDPKHRVSESELPNDMVFAHMRWNFPNFIMRYEGILYNNRNYISGCTAKYRNGEDTIIYLYNVINYGNFSIDSEIISSNAFITIIQSHGKRIFAFMGKNSIGHTHKILFARLMDNNDEDRLRKLFMFFNIERKTSSTIKDSFKSIIM